MLDNRTISSAAQRRTLRKREREERLIEAGHETLGERGLEGFTVEAVIAKAGLARRAFYDCFESKDDLLLVIFARSLAEGVPYFGAAMESAANPSQALANLLHGLIVNSFGDEPAGSLNRSIAFSHEHHKLAMSHPKKLDAAIEPFLALIIGAIEDAMAAGQFAKVDARTYARFIYNLVSASLHAELLNPSGLATAPERERFADDLCAFCMRALARP